MYAHIRPSDNQHQLSSRFQQRLYSHQCDHEEDDFIKERFNNLQSKSQEFDVFHQPSVDFYRTTTPSSRDSGIPIPSSSSSFCCSPTFERASTPKYSSTPHIQQERVLEFFLHPPTKNTRPLNFPINEVITPMSYIADTTLPSPSHRRTVHWNDESFISSREENDYNHSDFTTVKKCGQRISLSTSLPFYSKLNIRIRTHRDDSNKNEQVQTTARIQRLDPQHDHEHVDTLRQAYFTHYSTLSPNENIRASTTRIDSPIEYNELPPSHRRISLPIALPMHQRLSLYIRDGEVFARC